MPTVNRSASSGSKSSPKAEMLVGTTQLTASRVCDAQGKHLGSIDDIVIDTRTGCARYAVVALGGLFGIGCRRYAVPWSALTVDAESRRFVLDVRHLWLTGSVLDDVSNSRFPASS